MFNEEYSFEELEKVWTDMEKYLIRTWNSKYFGPVLVLLFVFFSSFILIMEDALTFREIYTILGLSVSYIMGTLIILKNIMSYRKSRSRIKRDKATLLYWGYMWALALLLSFSFQYLGFAFIRMSGLLSSYGNNALILGFLGANIFVASLTFFLRKFIFNNMIANLSDENNSINQFKLSRASWVVFGILFVLGRYWIANDNYVPITLIVLAVTCYILALSISKFYQLQRIYHWRRHKFWTKN